MLQTFPKLNLKPLSTSEIVFEGLIEDKVRYKDFEELEFSYEIKVVIPEKYPNKLPDFYMIDKSIEANVDLHIERTRKICIGVPLRLMIELNKAQSLSAYTDNVLIPYLYGLTYKLKNGEFPFNEIGHYDKGRIAEYKNMLQLQDLSSIVHAFELLGMERGNAHFEQCPCGCGKIYMLCIYMNVLEKYRHLANKDWYVEEAKKIGRWYE